MAIQNDENDDKPLDPAAERVRRKLVRFMAINLGILFAAVMAVVLAFVYKSVSEGPETAGEPAELPAVAGAVAPGGRLAVPAGAEVLSQSLSGARLSLLLAQPDGRRAVAVYDLSTGARLGMFDIVVNGE